MEFVQGFMVINSDTTETLYALAKGGRIFTTGEIKMSGSFNAPGREWKRVYEMPAEANLIGNYALPTNITKFA